MRSVILFGLCLAASTGCRSGTLEANTVDLDGDGQLNDVDCNDNDATSFVGAEELCDGIDNDCDGLIDDDPTQGIAYFEDTDGDGFGGLSSIRACDAPGTEWTETGGDCNDDAADTYPGAEEFCDGVDRNCDGLLNDVAIDGIEYFQDADGDGFGAGLPTALCVPRDEGWATADTDCDDTNADIHPDAPELCNNTDDNCNGDVDDAPTDGTTFYEDIDGDGFGDLLTETIACDVPETASLNSTDCNDRDSAIHPDAIERCNGISDDCDADIDEDAVDALSWYTDLDADRFGDPTTLVIACERPLGAVADNTDCNDSDNTVYPGAVEVCDELDNSCGDAPDANAVDASIWFSDVDEDGFGDGPSLRSCTQPEAYVANDDDCDDTLFAVAPGRDELCNDRDDDCDGTADNAAIDPNTYYLDADDDGFGDPERSALACDLPTLHVEDNTDCNDLDPDIYPEATEVCDDVDNDCNGTADDGVPGNTETNPGLSCATVLTSGCGVESGMYWLDPTGSGTAEEFYCDMDRDGGGWTRLFSTHWPTWWDRDNYEDVGSVDDDDYSALGRRDDFSVNGRYTLRLEVGNEGTWNTDVREHFTIWSQDHDPFTATTDGSDFRFDSGELSTTCGGFNGLHDAYYTRHGVYARSSDVDTGDSYGCWWMQVVPLSQYQDPESHPGYLEGYGGVFNYHTWQTLWIRGDEDLVDGDGRSAATAGETCGTIFESGLAGSDGRYWIDPEGLGESAAFEAYCDMTSDSGGWTLLATMASRNVNDNTPFPGWSEDWFATDSGNAADPTARWSNHDFRKFEGHIDSSTLLRATNPVNRNSRYYSGFTADNWALWNGSRLANTVDIVGPFEDTGVIVARNPSMHPSTAARTNGYWSWGIFYLGSGAGRGDADTEGNGARYGTWTNAPGQFGYIGNQRVDSEWHIWVR